MTNHELLLNTSKTLETGCEFKVVVCCGFGNGGDDCDVVTLGADIVGAGNDGDVDIYDRLDHDIQCRDKATYHSCGQLGIEE